MKRDLEQMESDAGAVLPPFVTRSTNPPSPKQRLDAFEQMHSIFAKFEQSFKHNFGKSP